MHTITLDFSDCKYIHDIHTVLKNTFKFPDCYGMNLDALWDCLKDLAVDYEHSFTICLRSVRTNNSDLQDYMIQILDLFADFHKEEPNVFLKIIS